MENQQQNAKKFLNKAQYVLDITDLIIITYM